MPKRPSAQPTPGEAPKPKRPRQTGFTVGPANLPDGTFRRKAQKIKRGLIHRAKLRKGLEKIKRDEGITSSRRAGDDDDDDEEEDEAAVRARRRMEMAMRDDDGVSSDDDQGDGAVDVNDDSSDDDKPPPKSTDDNDEEDLHTHPSRKQHTRRPRQSRYKNEISISKKVRDAKAERERVEKAKLAAMEKRETDRKARNKAMGGGKGAKTATGQMKLGRQSKGLLEKVERLVKG
ncbi:hypothetical protein TWF481_005990 [Arthrobotrys musiformis]|uniref:rRNA-processing protein FYV7 n=1 Tax=Arthrobotrys musiformis TaxID=47236 RepID=A0AAV9WGK8_9PEZI